MKYYFLASYLPELRRDDAKLRLGLADFLDEYFHIPLPDQAELNLVLLKGDLLVLERLLAGRAAPRVPSLHDPEFWRQEIKSPQDGPEFVQELLGRTAEQLPGPVLVDRLWEGYYLYALAQSQNPFLRAYLQFEWDLRNLLAAVRARRLGKPPAEAVVGEGEVAEALSRSGAEDFGLGRQWPWLEKLLAIQDPQALRDAVEGVLWDYLEENRGEDPFDFRAILVYLLELLLLESRLGLSQEEGAALLQKLETA